MKKLAAALEDLIRNAPSKEPIDLLRHVDRHLAPLGYSCTLIANIEDGELKTSFDVFKLPSMEDPSIDVGASLEIEDVETVPLKPHGRKRRARSV